MRTRHGLAPFAGAGPLFALIFSPCAWAQATVPADTTEQVVISGTRLTPTVPGVDAARLEAARVAGGASVIDAADYAASRAANLADVLALAPGVFIAPRFGAEEARLSIRGSGVQRTFHMRGIQLLQDGVPITLADGSGDFQAVEPAALAYTEVLRGANALHYGGTTLGGAVNFVSPTGRDAAGWRPRLEGGSFGYRRAVLSNAAAFTRSDYYVAVAVAGQEGYRDWSRQRSARLFADAGLALRDGLETRFYVAALDSDSQLPGALTRAQTAANPRAVNAASYAGRQKRDYQLYRLANRTVLELDAASLEGFAGYSYKDLWHPIFQVLQQRSDDFTAGARYVGSHALGERASRLVAGATSAWNSVDDSRFVNVAGRRGAPTALSRQRSGNLTLYAQEEVEVVSGLTLIGGVQWTEARRRYVDRFLANGDQGLEVSYARWSPRAGALWHFAPQWTLFANVSDSFEPPSFGELAGGANVDLLDAQRARTFEIGTRGSAGALQLDASLYDARVRNELLGLNTPTGQPLGTVNAPRTTHRGLELGARVPLAGGLSWRSAYLWNDFRFDGNATYGDNRLAGIPRHFYRGELAWQGGNALLVALSAEWSPARYPVDMAGTLFAAGYASFGVRVAREATAGLSWFVEGRNLADRNYAVTTGVVADARGQDLAQFYPGDGRAVYAGMSWRAQ